MQTLIELQAALEECQQENKNLRKANIDSVAWVDAARDEVAELQRQLEEARKVPEGWKLVPIMSTRTMGEAAAKLQADMYPEPPSFGAFYRAMLSAAPTTNQPKE